MSQNENDFGMLDAAVVMAESWRLLLGIPLLVAAITACALLASTSNYASTAIVRNFPLGILTARSTLEPVIQKLNLQEAYGPEMDLAVAAIGSRITLTQLPGNWAKIEARFPEPNLSQKVVATLIEETRRQSTPRFGERARLEAQLATLETAAANLKEYRDAILSNAGEQLGTAQQAESKALSLANLVENIVATEKQIADTKLTLQGLGPQDIISEPTSPDHALSKGIAALSIIAAIVASVAMLALVFIRNALTRQDQPSDTPAQQIA